MKGNKPFKTKKKRGGRFGLKRLKEKHREDLVIEGTPPRLDMSDVDVEFSLPKFKQRRSGRVEAEGAGGAAVKAKRKIRLALCVFSNYIYNKRFVGEHFTPSNLCSSITKYSSGRYLYFL